MDKKVLSQLQAIDFSLALPAIRPSFPVAVGRRIVGALRP
jgi:hypothetical protein